MAQVEMVEMEVEITPPEQMNVDVTVQSMDVDISAETMTGTVIQGIDEIKDKIDNIKLPDIDLTPVAKEATLTQGISSVESKVEEVGNKIGNIKLPEIDTTELAKQGENKEATNSAIYTRLEDALNLIDVQYANQINQLIGE